MDFSQNYSIARNYVGDRLFPDIKTENLEAEYERLSEGMDLPTAAMVHAFDTEAAIGVRPGFEKVSIEKLLIKEKINQSERLRQLLNHGVREQGCIFLHVVGCIFQGQVFYLLSYPCRNALQCL